MEFDTQTAVIKHLTDQGYKATRCNVSYHVKLGHLAKVNGRFPLDLVTRFAESYLVKSATGLTIGTSELIGAKELKTRLEAEKLQEQVHMARLQRERLQGKYISREEVYLELAARAVVIGTGLSHMFQIKGIDIISTVEGNTARYPELIEFLQGAADELLNSYASTDEFEVLFEEAAAGIEKTTDPDQG